MRVKRTIKLTVNGRHYERSVEVRKTLADFLRDDLDLTGTHLGFVGPAPSWSTAMPSGHASCWQYRLKGPA